MWGYMSSLWCSLHWYETTHYPCRSALLFVPELRIPSKGTSNTSHLLSPWPLAAACSLFQDIQWWIPITFLTHFAIQSGPTRKKHRIEPQHEPNMYINTFTWTPVFKTGCRLCICYWHLSQYEKWMLPSPRIDIDKIFLSDEVISWSLGKLTSSTSTWAGINDPWNDRCRCFPSIIVHRGPIVTHNNS